MGANYDVNSIEKTVILDNAQGPTRGWRISFTTKPSKLTGELDVAGDRPEPDAVDAALTDLAGALETIKAR